MRFEPTSTAFRTGLSSFAALLLAACSGGGDGGSAPPSGGTPTNPGPTWTSGVFQPSSVFQNRCQTVRTGVDSEGNAFPDRAGSTLEENFYLRSWTNETYLWNTEVIDQNPANFNDRLAYFAVLKTNATTPSGKPKDDFHFSQPTAEYLEQRNSTPRAGYGVRFQADSTTPPRDYRVRYTEPGSPAEAIVDGRPIFERGARILEVDGVDLINGGATDTELDILDEGLFPTTAGVVHTFRIEYFDGFERTVDITSTNIAPKPVNRTRIINTPTGPVGYILFNTFSPFASEREIFDAINAMRTAGVADLVLDLRYNGGGLLAVASQLGYMVAGPSQTSGRAFERLRFNAAAGNVNPVTGEFNDPIPFYSTGVGFTVSNGTPLPTLNFNRVFILTTDATCSASESVINALRGVFVDVVLIGQKTCGKPFGFYPESNCGETYYSIQFQGVNDQNFGDYADGFAPQDSPDAFAVKAPGCTVADDFGDELGDETEAMLATVLFYRDSGVCPPAPFSVSATSAARKDAAEGEAVAPPVDVFSVNRDMTMPQ